ncbi:hypothetical protein [Zobellia russellii]|uniref:hypothetical protein n=1 Tax=Zobellia russellii TaxID=248907 RepID=UPI001BFF79D9|nr:hypothetical protein [Zobellia russellii]MBT9187580.1 hypothetical protein [Zobellia russellii]
MRLKLHFTEKIYLFFLFPEIVADQYKNQFPQTILRNRLNETGPLLTIKIYAMLSKTCTLNTLT